MLDMTIYNKLKILAAQKELREGRKLTHRAIAEETGLPLSTITNYMTQKVERFDASTLSALCDYFGVDVGEILTYSTDPPAKQ